MDVYSVIKWTVVGRTQVDNTCDGRRLIYHTDRPLLFTGRCQEVDRQRVVRVHLRQLILVSVFENSDNELTY